MWQNNFLNSIGNFQNSSTEKPQYIATDGFLSFSPSPTAQDWFSQQSNMLQHGEDLGEQFSTTGTHSGIDLIDKMEFMQSQLFGTDGQGLPTQSPTKLKWTSPFPHKPAINARAQELKAQLKKSQEQRANKSPPPVIPGLATTMHSKTGETRSAIREPQEITADSTGSRPSSLDVEDLITSEAKVAATASAKKEQAQYAPVSPMRYLISTDSRSKSGSKITTPARKTSRLASSTESEASEGEIQEIQSSKSTSLNPPTEPKGPFTIPDKNGEGQVPRKLDAELYTTKNLRDEPRQDNAKSTRASTLNNEQIEHSMKTSNQGTNKIKQKNEISNESAKEHEPAQRGVPRVRDVSRRAEVGAEANLNKKNPGEQEFPALTRLIETDQDLKDWLVYTDYHNVEYRNKFLNRRRTLEALEVQKAKILEELRNEEHGRGIFAVFKSQLPAQVMTSSSLLGTDNAHSNPKDANAPSRQNVDLLPVQEVRPKRSYNEFQDVGVHNAQERNIRADGGRPFKSYRQSDFDDRQERPSPSRYDSYRKVSQDDLRRHSGSRYESGQGEERGRGQGNNHVRDTSPEVQVYESRPPPKLRVFDTVPEDGSDRDDWQSRRAFDDEKESGQKSHVFDPSYRDRGRNVGGRGGWNGSADLRPAYGQRIANGKPYKDSKGFDKGGKGETRYFIVKSFNEENVIRCIEDGFWTTQIQNGEIFKDAFETSKNVILVFSINQSRAFQGYARMESTPGSVDIPRWQKTINWESSGAFKVTWLTIASTRFNRVGHLKNSLNDNLAVLIGKDGQEIEEDCASELIKIIDEEADHQLSGAAGHKRYRDPPHYSYDD